MPTFALRDRWYQARAAEGQRRVNDETCGTLVVASRPVSEQPRFRAHARRKVRLRVVVWHPRAGWQREAEVGDLSVGGACLLAKDALAVGDRVTLSFVAPTLWDPLAIQGRVAWVGASSLAEPLRAGVAFEARDPSALLALFELLGSLAYED